ncbi:MAG: 50S ribosomal protein L13 [Candidatus Eutrophobiaceae bacterium]
MSTFSPKASDIQHSWLVVDAQDKILGRLATEVARRLRGKHKPEYTPHMDMGDYVIVINASHIRVTGNKEQNKKYYRHSGYPGGLKTISYAELAKAKPESIIEEAVRGMLPKGPLGRAMFRKLRVYSGTDHDHIAQQPQVLEI